jgi:hypothetical protein
MQDWYQPDDIWKAVGILDRDAFVQRCVFAGRFHTQVPEDVIRAYGTASHLMAQAWYHYPLYDEAIAKLLFTVEIAVKQRCQQVGVVQTTSNAAGRTRSIRLQVLIDQLLAIEPHKGQFLGQWLHYVRELRNSFAHPDRYSYGGISLRHHILPLLNLLNFLFLDEAAMGEAASYVAALRQQIPSAANLLGVTWQEANIVLLRAEPQCATQVDGQWRVIWAFYPLVSKLGEVLTRHQIQAPIVLTLTNLDVIADEMTGTDVATGQTVKLMSAPAGVAHLLLPAYQTDWQRATDSERQLFTFSQQVALTQAVDEQCYQHFWRTNCDTN